MQVQVDLKIITHRPALQDLNNQKRIRKKKLNKTAYKQKLSTYTRLFKKCYNCTTLLHGVTSLVLQLYWPSMILHRLV